MAYKPPQLEMPPRKCEFLQSPAQFLSVKELGAGGYSHVYLVEDLKTKEKYAMKKVLVRSD